MTNDLDYMYNLELVKMDVRNQYGNLLPDLVVTFVAMLWDAELGVDNIGNDYRLDVIVVHDKEDNSVRVTDFTNSITYSFSWITGQLLYIANWQS